MTREEAINELNFYRNQHYADSTTQESRILADAINEILHHYAALREQEERSKGCWACYLPVMRGRLRQELRQVLGVNPLLCPMCGRKLEEDC